MNKIKLLVEQTATYGISSILGRILNTLLVPLYARVFIPAEAAVFVTMYSYVAFFIIILTYGMETAFFRNYQNSDNKKNVYSTVLWSIISTSSLFLIVMFIFQQDLATLIKFPENPEYIIYFAFIVVFDAIASIPFAKLRADSRPIKFVTIRLISIFTNICFNLLLILVVPYLYNNSQNDTLVNILSYITSGKADVEYVFVSNLISSSLTLVLLFPEMLKAGFNFSVVLWKKMIVYALPLLIFGLVGVINETIDRILLLFLLPEETAMHYVGIYGMCFKISIFISIFIQAFRYAAEPFFFAQSQNKDAKEIYSTVMNYFIIVCLSASLGIMLYMDVIKYFVSEMYFEGLVIVPILLLAHVFLGIFYNLSVWYKINDKTRFGAYFGIAGAVVSLSLNFLLIPKIGYIASAWANFAAYLTMMLISYFYGQKHYPVPYKVKKFLLYTLFSAFLYFISLLLRTEIVFIDLSVSTIIFIGFIAIVLIAEPDLKSLMFRFIRINRQKG